MTSRGGGLINTVHLLSKASGKTRPYKTINHKNIIVIFLLENGTHQHVQIVGAGFTNNLWKPQTT